MADWDGIKEKTDAFLKITKEKLSKTGDRLKQEGRVVQKRLDLLALQRKITQSYAELGKIIYEASSKGVESSKILEREEVSRLLAKIESLRQEAAQKEKEMKGYKLDNET